MEPENWTAMFEYTEGNIGKSIEGDSALQLG
jgi:hypothetical protein